MKVQVNSDEQSTLSIRFRQNLRTWISEIDFMKNKPYPIHFLKIILFLGGETRFGNHHMQQIYMNQLTTRIQHELGVSSFIDGMRKIQLQQALREGLYIEMKDALVLQYEAAKLVKHEQRCTCLIRSVKEQE